MKITGDQQLIKKINKFIVLDTIRRYFPISRADIATRIGLNKSTVSSLVNELIESRLVSETGLGESSGGRKPMMLLFNNAAGYVIGVDLGVNYILVLVTDLAGNIVREKKIQLAGRSIDAVIEKLKKGIHALRKKIPSSPYGFIGIGIGVPGIVDDQGNILSAPNLNWENVPLRSILQEEFSVETTIDNEANMGALGEQEFGAGRTVTNLIYVSVGIGIGAGIIINNALYQGLSGFSGEIGHMAIETDGPLCGCGNQGCWETFASENALIRKAKLLPLQDNTIQIQQSMDEMNLHTLLNLAKKGNGPVTALFTETGHLLGVGIANLVNIFNPELIIIGNRMSMAQQLISDSLQATLDARSLPFHRAKTKVSFSQLGIYSSALGASSVAVNRFFSAMKATWE